MTQTIGQRLKTEREQQRLTLEKVFEATRIRVQYLKALEEDDFSVMPSPVQARGYLRNYAEYLGFDVEQLLRELRETNAQQPSGEVIGPADAAPTEAQNAETQATPPTVESVEEIRETAENNELTVPIKPTSTRRKKRSSEPMAATDEPRTRQRGRKKVEQEVTPVVETEPAVPDAAVPEMEPIPQSDPVEEPATAGELDAPVEMTTSQVTDEAQEIATPVDVSDSLWHAWLSRLNSILSARARRKTLTPKESPFLEAAPTATPLEMTAGQETPPAGSETYTQILKEIGKELRQRRELLSLHFEEVERNTHVKAHYLDALERGALDELPSTVQTRGMLSNYATFLDLDVDALLLRFADALQARHRERNPHKPARKPGQPILANIPPVRTFIAGDLIFGIGMAVLLVGFAIWGVNRVMTIQSQQGVEPTSPSISDVLLAYPNPSSPMATATFVLVESFPAEATVTVEIPTQNVNAPVQLNLVAVERTYLRVVADGEVAFEGRVVPGNAYPFEAEEQIEVLVGSGAAIRIVYNGRDLGLMGTFGQVVNNIYLSSEIVTPTGLPTATPTVTPTPTRTEPPSATPRSSATPAPSATGVP